MSIKQSFQQIVLTLPVSLDPSLAIAASRAGELGILNLEFAEDITAVQASVAQMSKYVHTACGLKIASGNQTLLQHFLDEAPPKVVNTLILTPHNLTNLQKYIPQFKQRGMTILLEVTSARQAQEGESIGVDGLIAKGNEAAGWVGKETTFILVQKLLPRFDMPVYAYGGIGLHSAAACYAAGAAGVVLDTQLALTRESALSPTVKRAIAMMDGSETICLGEDLDYPFRVYQHPQATAVTLLQQTAVSLAAQKDDREVEWFSAIRQHLGWEDLAENLWPLDQAAVFAAPLAQTYKTVGGVLQAIRESVIEHTETAAALKPLDQHSPLALSHNTQYPIVQGPMTRVSDRAEFVQQVAEGGGLPFLALALMRAPDVERLLAETKELLGKRPWGVGILGFVPLELRQEQLEIIRQYKPPYAIIAGGRPDQAQQLEAEGIATYLHVPSPGLLKLFLQDGARRFIFEGRECGGHVGPRSSFVLWNTMVDVLLQELPADEAQNCHILFAGGIHNRLSSAMVAALAAPLAQRGVRIGVLMGTAYLFTEEAISSGSIMPSFQEEAVACQQTILLESGPGHATRCIPTSFARAFHEEKQRLRQEKKSSEEIRHALESLNIGRLRIASKGITRHPQYGQNEDAPKYIALDSQEQRRDGLYMIGQVAALRDQVCTIAELHQEVSVGSVDLIAETAVRPDSEPVYQAGHASQIAIIGMSVLLPKAKDLAAFWANILNGVDAITEVPRERWDANLYFDSNRQASDKIYSRAGGFLDDISFDPLEFGIPPNSLKSIDPLHLLALVAARDALNDAGYAQRPFDRSRTSVILGASGGTGDLGANYLLRAGLPLLFGEEGFDIAQQAGDALPEWTEDSFAGLLLNVAAGRIANRFDFGGLNYVVDAACASSLAAVHLAVKELETHNTDTVIVGGVDTVQNPFGYLCFSKTQALSPTGKPRVFDAEGDGIVISEGVVMLVLKRVADAERDGDRVYAVISGVGGSSDGRAMGMTAPRPEGQALALQRAYDKAGFSPATVALFEAHGTGTVVGDRTEAKTLSNFLQDHKARLQQHAIGSVKSMVGHTKATAGVAGIAKVASALYHKTLPATLGVTTPNPKAGLRNGPLYVNSETRPWIHHHQTYPRRAGVSAFGFGGTNFHAALEEYRGDFRDQSEATLQIWPSELLIWTARSRAAMIDDLSALREALRQGAEPALGDLAYSLYQKQESGAPINLAIVGNSLADVQQKIEIALTALQSDAPLSLSNPNGIYLSETPLAATGKLAFLFAGQGSQYVNMLRDLAIHFSEVRGLFERVDGALDGRYEELLSRYIFPPPAFTPADKQGQKERLSATNIAQPALGAANMSLFQLLKTLGIQADMVAGHSYGEYTALCAAEVFDFDTLIQLSEARGRFIIEEAESELGTMRAVWCNEQRANPIVAAIDGVWIANLNAPEQTIISGTDEGLAAAAQRFEDLGINSRPLPVACAFHSPLVAPAKQRLAALLKETDFAPPKVAIFANTTAQPYPPTPQAVQALLTEQLVQPVRFLDQIEAMYAANARIFVEIGPRNVLTNLTQQILGDRPHIAVAVDAPHQHGLTQLQHTLGQLASQGVPIRMARLFQGRKQRRLNLSKLSEETRPKPPSPTTWLVNGSRAKPYDEPDKPSRQPLKELLMLKTNGHSLNPESDANMPLAQPDNNHPSPHHNGQTTVSPSLMSTLPPDVDDTAAQVMALFQQTMSNFLETQRAVMTAYLQGYSTPSPSTGYKTAVLPATQQSPLASAPRAPETSPPTQTTEAAPPIPAESEVLDTGNGAPTKDSLTQQLLTIVSDRTGYPAEMLDMKVDIEADLGIDSIKRVEILGILQRESFPPDHEFPAGAMEELTSLKTLNGIVNWFEQISDISVSSNRQTATDVAKTTLTQTNGLAKGENRGKVTKAPRSILTAVSAPPAHAQVPNFSPDRIILITDDGCGLGQALADVIEREGGQARLVDLTENTVPNIVAAIRQGQGSIGGIIHLQPLRPALSLAEMDLSAWHGRLQQDVKCLFELLQTAISDLKKAAVSGQGWIIAATKLGEWLIDNENDPNAFTPGQAGVAGLLKSVALEWEDLTCKTIHLDKVDDIEHAADRILHEMAAQDGLAEIVYRHDGRYQLQPKLQPLKSDQPQLPQPNSDWVILLTGGARGITAEIACELAQKYQPKLILLGRSAMPPAHEAAQTAGLKTAKEIKAALIEEIRQTESQINLKDVETSYHNLLKAREIRQNLSCLREAGAQVQYIQVDVRDEPGMQQVLDDIYQQYGRVDGVIHGAGVIEDKLIEDKSMASFNRVFDTKTDSAFILTRHLQTDSLKFLFFFSSVAGIFGNRGQSDYAAANEILSKLARYLDQRWSARVTALNWGPWLTGMVTPELEQAFNQRRIQLISIPAGCHAMMQELRLGQKGESELILAGGEWGRKSAPNGAVEKRGPLLDTAVVTTTNNAVEVTYKLDPKHDRYLLDHQLDGQPVFPFAMAMELMAEVVNAAWPHLNLTSLQDMQILAGIPVKSAKDLKISAQAIAPANTSDAQMNVSAQISDLATGRVHYRGTITLSAQTPTLNEYHPPSLEALRPFSMSVSEAYETWLFHGPIFQGITAIHGIAPQMLAADIRASAPKQALAGQPNGDWLIDPIVFDSALQLIILWNRFYKDATPLPSRFKQYRRFAPLSHTATTCYLLVPPDTQRLVTVDIAFVNSQGQLVGYLEGMECPTSQALNRLAGQVSAT